MNSKAVLIREERSLLEFLQKTLDGIFARGDRVAIKLHMGEPGNPYSLKPVFVREICGLLHELGCEPFLFDTPVTYYSPRNSIEGYLKSAAANGYEEGAIGAPIVISNESVAAEGTLMTYGVAKVPLDADGILLLSHFKGHIASGMGGAVKNIGMGCMSKETKTDIHTGGEPIYEEGCIQCGACVEGCPTDNIVLEDNGPSFGKTWCSGCSNCAVVCPEECIQTRLALFDELIAEAAAIAHKRFKKFYAVNVLKDITKLCDCIADSGPIIVEDIGYVCGHEMVSVDSASLQLVARATGKEDIFAEYNLNSSWEHVRAAARFMGSKAEAVIEEME